MRELLALPPPKALAVRALVMGFSWAVYLAQITLEDSLLAGVPWVTTANQLAHGRPVPALTRSGAA